MKALLFKLLKEFFLRGQLWWLGPAANPLVLTFRPQKLTVVWEYLNGFSKVEMPTIHTPHDLPLKDGFRVYHGLLDEEEIVIFFQDSPSFLPVKVKWRNKLVSVETNSSVLVYPAPVSFPIETVPMMEDRECTLCHRWVVYQ